MLGSVAEAVSVIAVPDGLLEGSPVNEAVGVTFVTLKVEVKALLVSLLSWSVAVRLTVYVPPYSGVKL